MKRGFFSIVVVAFATLLLTGTIFAAWADNAGNVDTAAVVNVQPPDNAKSWTTLNRIYAGYSARGSGASWYRNSHINSRFREIIGVGFGMAWNTLLDVSLDARWTFPHIGVQNAKLSVGASTTWGIIGFEPIALHVGFQYDEWLFEMGYSYGGRYDFDDNYYDDNDNDNNLGSSFSIRAGTEFSRRPIEETAVERKVRNPNRKRYFRFGWEVANYNIWMNETEFLGFDDPPVSGGLGFFARIGPEPVYFSTGLYGRIDYFYKEGIVSSDLNLYGISFGTLRLLDAEMAMISLETPFLLNFGSSQVRFVGGVLLDYLLVGGVMLSTNENLPIIGGRPLDLNEIEIILDEAFPEGNMYWVLGLDLDIFRNWGIGVKYLIHNHSFGEYEERFGFEPSQHQIRFSTYFVF